MTIFSPLTLAYKLVGPRIVADLRAAPQAVEAGLSAIAETTSSFAALCLDAGADGIFFASQLATRQFLTAEEYARFGEPFDRTVLDAVADSSWFTVLHLHGTEIFFDLANAYPVQAVSWHDRETKPGLADALHLTDRILMAGLDRRLLETGGPAEIEEQVRSAVAVTGGSRLILAPSCVIPTGASEANLDAVARAVYREQ
jgi:uroporphyrinogen decarboxylase